MAILAWSTPGTGRIRGSAPMATITASNPLTVSAVALVFSFTVMSLLFTWAMSQFM